MSITYPGTVDVFTNPTAGAILNSPSHAGQHSDANDAIEAIEAVLGTTTGTSVLKNIPVGKFAVATTGGTLANGLLGTSTITGGTASAILLGTSTITGGTISGVLLGTSQMTGGSIAAAVIGTPTMTGGSWTSATITASVLGTPTITGGAHNAGSFGTPTIVVGSDATGDMFYRGSGTTVSRLGIGTANQVLTTDGTTPSWGAPFSSKIITATRDLAAATADVAYASVGFKPTAIDVIGYIEGGYSFVVGFSDSSKAGAAITPYGTNTMTGLDSFIYCNLAGAFVGATIKSYDTDGFTLTWTKTGSPTGTLNLKFRCTK